MCVCVPGDPAGEAGDANGEDSDRLDVALLTTTIRSEWWWFYAQMILRLNSFSSDFSSWCEGCECHFWLKPKYVQSHAGGRSRAVYSDECEQLRAARKSQGFQSGHGDGPEFSPCPLAGRRAPQLAAGAAESYMEELGRSYLLELMECCSCTDPSETDQVLSDFSLGKASMISYLAQKLQCWRVLPWRLAALCVEDVDEARRHAKEALDEFVRPPSCCKQNKG